MKNVQCLLALYIFSPILAFSLLCNVRPLQAQGDACEADRVKYCPSYRDDNPRRFYCLKANITAIKPSCKSMLRDVSGTEDDFIYECTDDYKALCGDVPEGKGRILKCLKANSKKLSFECRKMVVVFPEPR